MEAALRPTGVNMQGFLAGAQVIAQFSIWFLATAPAGTVEFTGGWWEISPEARLVHRGQGRRTE